MLTWSSLRLLAGIWCDVCLRWPIMLATGWLRDRAATYEPSR